MKTYLDAMRLDNKVALVTGAARGLGAEMAKALAQAGARVLLSDILEEEGRAVAAQLTDSGASAIFLCHDVTQESDWIAAVEAACENFGGLDIVVNNAGIETASFFADCELADFQRTLAVNVEGGFLGIKHAIRTMRPGGASGRGGSIINLSSTAGLSGAPGLGAYGAAKGAVRLMSKAAAVECARLGHGIRVNSVHPGLVMTDMGNNAVKDFVRIGLLPDEATAEGMLAMAHPLGFGQPQDIASAVLYLASDASRWVTGIELVVDGGFSAT